VGLVPGAAHEAGKGGGDLMAVISWKPINPKAMNDKAVRFELLNALRKVGTDIKGDFEKTIKTWEHKPKFDVEPHLSGRTPWLFVGTPDKIYRYVDRGTREHPIEAGIYTGRSNKRALAFKSKFRPKTRPRYITAYTGFKGGKTVLRARVPKHPGTKPREFEATLQKRWQLRFAVMMRAAMLRGARKSGHAMR